MRSVTHLGGFGFLKRILRKFPKYSTKLKTTRDIITVMINTGHIRVEINVENPDKDNENPQIQKNITNGSLHLNTAVQCPINAIPSEINVCSNPNHNIQLNQYADFVAPIIFIPSAILAAFSSTNELTFKFIGYIYCNNVKNMNVYCK